MKKLTLNLAALCGLLLSLAPAFADIGTAFTYQGLLTENGTPATGIYDFRFNLYATDTDTTRVAPERINSAVPVTNGMFMTRIDFGDVFHGASYWLDIGSRTNGSPSDFTPLNPREELTPTPYSMFAATAGKVAGNGVTGGMIAAQTVVRSLNGITDFVTLTPGPNVTITPYANSIQISASGSGGGLTLPFSQSAASSSPLFSANNTGNGTGLSGVGGDKGVYGSTGSAGPTHAGVFGENSAVLGTAVIGNALNTDSAGVAGIADTARSTGVYGRGNSIGVSGNSSSRYGYGVYGSSPLGVGVYGTGLEAGHFDGDVSVTGHLDVSGGVTFSDRQFFGNKTRQMLNLWGTAYGIGVQAATEYFRTDGGFAWYYGGSHDDTQNYPGLFGKTLMTLDGNFLTVYGAGNEQAYIGGDGVGSDVQIGSRNPAVSSIACWNAANNSYMHLYCSSLTIQGGADLAEPFQITSDNHEISQGTVVVIDEENSGHLKMSDRPYDTRVAGIVSGANGVNPGIQMQQQGLLEGGKNVALTGRVYVQADASNGAIKPGDLLTSSSLAGHAMKVTDAAKAQGAILGKAMSSLSEGKGMVLVLVTLQ